MKTLEQEAEEYSAQFGPVNHHERVPSFIAGVNSKWVQAEKIKAQIEEIQIIINCHTLTKATEDDLKLKIERKQQQLKQLKDETKI
jgi:hypothetical protein